MLKENIRRIRIARGLSQEALARRINVVRQTVSKWEQGLSVPDAELLLALSDVLEAPVHVLLGEAVSESPPDDLTVMAEKLEAINLRLAEQSRAKWKALSWLMFSGAAVTAALLVLLAALKSPYLRWDYSDPETAVAGTVLHAFEYLFVRFAPAALLFFTAGGLFAGRKQRAAPRF